jgi:hypothetical protein
MAEEKVYKFSGDSSGLESAMSKIRSAASNTFSSLSTESDKYNKSLETQGLNLSRIVDEAHKYSVSSKEQVKYINDVAKAIEAKNRTEYLETISSSREIRDSETAGISGEIKAKKLRGSKAEDYYNERKSSIDTEYKESVKNAKEEYQERKLQTNYLKQLPDAIKNSSKDQIVEGKKNGENLQNTVERLEASSDPKDKITANILREQVDKEEIKNRKNKVGGNESQDSFFSSIMKLEAFRGIASALQSATGSQTGYDLTKPLASAVGSAALAIPFAGAPLSFIANITGDLLQRKINAQEGYSRSQSGSNAAMGNNFGRYDLSSIGYDYETVANSSGEIAKRYGSSKNLSKNIGDTFALERGYGINQSMTSSLVEIQRNSNKDIASTIIGILNSGKNSYFAGGDRTFLGEFTQKFTQLQKELLKGSTKVSDVTTYDILSKFNNVGGQFSTNDYRSMGNISSVQNSLANPSSEAFKAMAFSALRKNNPNASLFDIQSEMEKGLSSQNYLQTVMQMVNGLGGSDDYKKFSLQGIFGLSAAATNDLFNGKGELGKFAKGDFLKTDGKQIFQEAIDKTSTADRNTAEIKNAFVEGATDGILKVADKFVESMLKQFQELNIGDRMYDAVYDAFTNKKQPLIGSQQQTNSLKTQKK